MNDLPDLPGRGELYFLRHGQTEGPERGFMKGRLDLPLSAEGRRQAEAAGVSFRGRGIDLILTSPLRRARLTAETVARVIGCREVRSSALLTEFDIGIFTGLTQASAREKYPEAYAAFQREGWDAVPGAEKSDSCYARAVAFWTELAGFVAAGRQRILSIGHKGIFQWVLRASFGCRNRFPLFEIDACGLYRLSFDTTDGTQYFIWDILNQPAGRENKIEDDRG